MANFINYQYRVCGWIRRCFPLAVVYDKLERGDRFLEESLELLQAADYPKERVAALVRPEVMERIRMKQASKPVGSALPGAYPENTDG
jgi:hypothetical protein